MTIFGRFILRSSKSINFTQVRFCKALNDPLEHATGIEKRELLAKMAGNDNPFDLKVFKRGAGTADSPNCVPSSNDSRLIGCICDQEDTHVQYMWLKRGTPKRCECGHWFKLVEKAPL